MSVKTYLQEQIRLVSLLSRDLYTDEEIDLYKKIIDQKNILDLMDEKGAEKEERQSVITEKNKLKAQLNKLILSHADTPRTVNLRSVIYYPKDADYPFPEGVTYRSLKTSKKIAEFCCELSRAMGLENLDCTLDLIVIKWSDTEILRQLVMNGFYMPVLSRDGNIEIKHYRFFTASAGQLRRDKIQCISDNAWAKVHKRLECGMNWDLINERGGINPNKFMAYLSLASSATEEWVDFDIDRCIVIPEFEAPVTDRMMYIKPDYSYEIGLQTVIIDHTDGCGMMLPEVSMLNFMVRSSWIKGLLCSFDFIKWCEVNNVEPVLEDAWHVKHNLVEERINVILTTSMFKLHKLYKNWDEYKKFYKENGCRFCKTNYEEEYIPDTYLNYQEIQTLQDVADDEIKLLTAREHDRIENLTKNIDAMLNTLKADEESEQPYKVALKIYPELLREAQARQSLIDIRKRMLLDAKSGRIKCLDKRLYVIPDLWAACEYWFTGNKTPKGLLAKDEIACKVFRRHDKADVLRSPHLYCEHSLQKIVHDQKIYDWFYTNGVYTSVSSMISRILQFDVDGDQLNVIVEPLFVKIADRNVKKYDVIPLFYDAEKANAEPISNESLYKGLVRAHEYSNIGEISNMLTRVWNKNSPDRVAAALLTYLNNLRIDGAKTGVVHEYEDYPEVKKQINRACSGRNGRMPAFFIATRNGRKNTPENRNRKYAEPNNSTMNRICRAFDDIGYVNLNYAGVPQFNYQMLMSGPCNDSNPEVYQLFCEFDNSNKSSVIASQENPYASEKQLINNYSIVAEDLANELIRRYGSLEYAYPYIVKYLFAGEGMDKSAHKQMFWRVFGQIALENIRKNLSNCDICPDCYIKIPAWVENHNCTKNAKGFYECIDCHVMCERTNPKQCRCPECQSVFKNTQKKLRQRNKRELKKAIEEKRITSLGSSLNKT